MYKGLLLLLSMLRQMYPQFLNTYRIMLQDAVPTFANHIRNLILPMRTQGIQITDDYTGLLCFPETDISECFNISSLSKETIKYLQ